MAATTIEGAIAERLAADEAIIAVIGTTPIVPISDPSPLPRPRLYYQTLTGQRLMSNDGPAALTQTLIFFYASAGSLLVAKQLARLVRTSLEGFRGTLGEQIHVACIRCGGPIDEAADIAPGQSKAAQRVRLEITVDWHDA
jgi:hypothetical protein